MVYAIIEASGKQICVHEGKFYDLNHVKGEPGDLINLHRVLFVKQEDNIQVGKPCLKTVTVQAKILKHLKGRKVIVFKMKPKKNTRSKKGHRQNLTRLLIQEIIS